MIKIQADMRYENRLPDGDGVEGILLCNCTALLEEMSFIRLSYSSTNLR